MVEVKIQMTREAALYVATQLSGLAAHKEALSNDDLVPKESRDIFREHSVLFRKMRDQVLSALKEPEAS